ncbi:hypothetical protein CRUP_013886 [Coryphaenoides rupestris]|nr:hypothetical protein CRUP_013886 [Coryphaenoides rupestris]
MVGRSVYMHCICELNMTPQVEWFWAPDLDLKAEEPVGPVDVPKMEYRSKVKDVLILLQGVMLASCIAALLLRRYTLVKKEEAIYEDPQQDHIYEGLVVETCEGELYEDISGYIQTGGAEATWEKKQDLSPSP